MYPKKVLKDIRPGTNLSVSLNMDSVKNCSWCEIGIPNNATINIHDNAQNNKCFCSEKCFESSRRATFKKTKMCDWCDKMSISDTNGKCGSDYSSTSIVSLKSDSVELIEVGTNPTVDHLQFCNDTCLTNYKQTYFAKETTEVLQVKKEKTVGHMDKTESQTKLKPSIMVDSSITSFFSDRNIPQTKNSKQLYRSPKMIRSATIPKLKSSRKVVAATPLVHQKMNNLCHFNVNPLFSPLNIFSDFVNPCTNPIIPNFTIPKHSNPKPTENTKQPLPNPIYIPIPIPIPIPIFKNAPEILEILHQYGYKQSKHSNSENRNPKATSPSTQKPSKIISESGSELQTEALDLSGGSFDSPTDYYPQKNTLNIATSFPIASILHMNDPYLKRRNRILDAPPTSTSDNLNHQITSVKSFNLNYTELLSHSQIKATKFCKRKNDKNDTHQKSTTSCQVQTPKHIVHTAKSLLRRYPLISLRRNIKSAPSSVLDSNNK